jgi:hypothetical protein
MIRSLRMSSSSMPPPSPPPPSSSSSSSSFFLFFFLSFSFSFFSFFSFFLFFPPYFYLSLFIVHYFDFLILKIRENWRASIQRE